MRKIKVGIIQQANTADLRTNLMNLAKSIEACAAHGAQLVVLQELHNSLYFCQTENTQLFDLAETIPGPSTGFYSELAAANKIVLVTSLFEKRAPRTFSARSEKASTISFCSSLGFNTSLIYSASGTGRFSISAV